MSEISKYLDGQKDFYLKKISEFVAIQSISADKSKSGEMARAAKWVAGFLAEMGVKKVEILKTSGSDAVYGELSFAPGQPTLLVYGHYDVVPVGDEALWQTPPFEMMIRDGRMYGRGTSDDKGQLLMVLFAIAAYAKAHKAVPVNFKFFIEGNEEYNSDSTMSFIPSNKDRLKCDAVLVCENIWIAKQEPSVLCRLRGAVSLSVRFKGPKRDLHSGIYGGMVANPINAMIEVIGKLRNEQGKIMVPHFYDDVLELSAQDKKMIADVPFAAGAIKSDLGIAEFMRPEAGYTVPETNHARPSFDVCGVGGGYFGEGFKNAIPTHCDVKLSWRTVSNQDEKKIAVAAEEFIRKNLPPGITAEIKKEGGASPMRTDPDSIYIQAMVRAMERITGNKTYIIFEPATSPLAAVFGRELGVPIAYMGVGLPSDYIHSPNENLDLDNFFIGMKIVANYFDELKNSL